MYRDQSIHISFQYTRLPYIIPTFPFYGQEVNEQKVFWWRYSIRIENLGDSTVQLRERHWRIFSLSGTLETVRGRGVIGKVRGGEEEREG